MVLVLAPRFSCWFLLKVDAETRAQGSRRQVPQKPGDGAVAVGFRGVLGGGSWIGFLGSCLLGFVQVWIC